MATEAKACVQALRDADRRWPDRDNAADGIMGDARHQNTQSDHNQGNAVDITHDPSAGCTGDLIAEKAIDDPRAKYVIWNKRINYCNGKGWQAYKGSNPHTKHCHISIKSGSRNDDASWPWAKQVEGEPTRREAGALRRPQPRPPEFPGALKLGDKGEDVGRVQARLAALGWRIRIDKEFGPGTRVVVQLFQKRVRLRPTGEVDAATWKRLWTYDPR